MSVKPLNGHRWLPLTRLEDEGGGCYACKHQTVCAMYRGMSWLVLVLAEACTRFEPREKS